MRSKKKILSNFTNSIFSPSFCLRPDNEKQLHHYMKQHKSIPLLARGAGLSYSDSCLHSNGKLIDTQRLNHFISFDDSTGMLECQAAVTFKDLFLLHKEFIPPVFPGTAHATMAGGIAHDVHGKNNHKEGSFGQHVVFFDLLIDGEKLRCSRETNSDLFYSSLGGAGLTGIITKLGLRLKKASRTVEVKTKAYHSIDELIKNMSTLGLNFDYQMAWLDLTEEDTRSLHTVANHCKDFPEETARNWVLPKMPFCLVSSWNIKLLNAFLFKHYPKEQRLSLFRFNNPLDFIQHWTRCYGKKGLIQFQVLFPAESALHTLNHLLQLIKQNRATATLAVLKLFTKKGEGLLSFCKPGFTLAIDFIHTKEARQAIMAMNQYSVAIGGRIYLAKDLLLTQEQFEPMYENIRPFKALLSQYNSPMQSDLAKRLRLIP